MRFDTTRNSGPSWGRRNLALLIATGAGVGSLLLGALPAQANDTTKQVAPDGQTVVFHTHDSSHNVSGDVDLIVTSAGNWQITGGAKNDNLLFRNVHWVCDLTWDASSVGHATGTTKVPGKKTRTLSAAAYDPFVQAGFAAIVERGRADCDIVTG
jgi:hypothetical protein